MKQIESLNINPHTYGQLIFGKYGSNIPWRKDILSVSSAGKAGQAYVNQRN